VKIFLLLSLPAEVLEAVVLVRIVLPVVRKSSCDRGMAIPRYKGINAFLDVGHSRESLLREPSLK